MADATHRAQSRRIPRRESEEGDRASRFRLSKTGGLLKVAAINTRACYSVCRGGRDGGQEAGANCRGFDGCESVDKGSEVP